MSYEIPVLVAGVLIGAVVVYFALRSHISAQVSSLALNRAQRIASQLFETQKEQLDKTIRQTHEAQLEQWKTTTLAQAIAESRADALNTSRAVLNGKIAEQMAPFLPSFLANFHPADARFIGSPIGYLIFKNMNKGADSDDPIDVVLLDVKTGKSQFNAIQKIQDATEEKRIRFEVLKLATGIDTESPETTHQ